MFVDNETLPGDIRDDALKLQADLAFDDEGGDGVSNSIDDEYKWAGVDDPKIMITTSHDPSAKLKQFAKVIVLYVILGRTSEL